MKLAILCFILINILGCSGPAFSCASCGSGAGNPLVFSPDQNQKIYFGFGHEDNFGHFTYSGKLTKDHNLSQRYRLEYSHGFRIHPKATLALNLKAQRSTGNNESRTGLTDPTLMSRYDIQLQSLASLWRPQIQLLSDLQIPLGVSTSESKHPTLLDVTGSGYLSGYLGTDIWWGMNNIVFGTNLLLKFPLLAKNSKQSTLPGHTLATTMTTGYRVGKNKVLIGINLSQTSSSQVNNTKIPNSNIQQIDGFTTLELEYDETSEIRFTASQVGINGFPQKLASRITTLLIGYIKLI